MTDSVACTHSSPEPPAPSVGLYQANKGNSSLCTGPPHCLRSLHETQDRILSSEMTALGDEVINWGWVQGHRQTNKDYKSKLKASSWGTCDHTSQSFPSSVHSPSSLHQSLSPDEQGLCRPSVHASSGPDFVSQFTSAPLDLFLFYS